MPVKAPHTLLIVSMSVEKVLKLGLPNHITAIWQNPQIQNQK